MTGKKENQMWEILEKCAREGLGADSHFYKAIGDRENGAWYGMALAFRRGSELDAGCEFMAAAMAENLPWQLMKRAAELGKLMEETGVPIIEAVPGWCALIDEHGEALPEDDDEEDLF